ncbi:hypothetical protein AFK68_01910, partial [Hydrocoleum sp. CS-953]|uniref:hypothetical protein n=2 Tax=Microcoleaceae TaxID=1892252 RepID=UPI000BCC94A1
STEKLVLFPDIKWLKPLYVNALIFNHQTLFKVNQDLRKGVVVHSNAKGSTGSVGRWGDGEMGR